MGITISGICAVHCLLFPILIVLLPIWPSLYNLHEWTHPILFLLIVPTVYLALRGRVKHFLIPILLYSGLVIVGVAWMLSSWIGYAGEAVVTTAGSLLMIGGHWINYRETITSSNATCSHETT